MAMEWNSKLMRTCWEALLETNKKDKRFMRKLVQVMKRCQNLDKARAFQHWHHTAQSVR